MVGDRIPKPAKTAHYLLWIDTKNRLLGHDLFPNSLTSNTFQTNGDKEARTPDPYNAIVVLYQLSYDPKLVSNLLDRVSPCQVGFSF
jgi:hypothetical protein